MSKKLLRSTAAAQGRAGPVTRRRSARGRGLHSCLSMRCRYAASTVHPASVRTRIFTRRLRTSVFASLPIVAGRPKASRFTRRGRRKEHARNHRPGFIAHTTEGRSGTIRIIAIRQICRCFNECRGGSLRAWCSAFRCEKCEDWSSAPPTSLTPRRPRRGNQH